MGDLSASPSYLMLSGMVEGNFWDSGALIEDICDTSYV